MKSDATHMEIVVNDANAQENATAAISSVEEWPLKGSEAELFDTILANHILWHMSKHYSQTTINAITPVLKDIVRKTGKAPWHWSEEDFESWSASHRDAGNKSNTLQSYRGIVRRYLEYILKRQVYTGEIWNRYKIRFKVVAHEDNCVVSCH